MSRHTPGPWEVVNGAVYRIANSPWENGKLMVPIALMDRNNGNGTTPTERDKNARLIAAAPELLELAEKILLEWEAPVEGVHRGTLIARLSQYSERAREVIRKAKGIE